jgi:hypothetical protein
MKFEEYYKNSGSVRLLEDVQISEELAYIIFNKQFLRENVFRIYSNKYFDLIKEAKHLYKNNKLALDDEDVELIETSIGEKALYEGREVFLDAPIYLEEDVLLEAKHHGKNVKLSKPFRTPGGPKKFAVYVKTPKGTIKKVTFGDPNLKVRNNSKARAKSFRARHKCSQKKDKTTAGYWSCNIARYRKALGLKSSRPW